MTYTVAGSAATDGSDYTALTGTVTVLADETTATIAVIPVEDAEVEGTESVIVTLTDGDAYDLGAATEAEVTIADDSVVDINGNTQVTGSDVFLITQYLLLEGNPNRDAILEGTFALFPSETGGAVNTTGSALSAAIGSQLSLFDIDGNGTTSGGDAFLIGQYLLFGSNPNINNILEQVADAFGTELTGNTTGTALNTALSSLLG